MAIGGLAVVFGATVLWTALRTSRVAPSAPGEAALQSATSPPSSAAGLRAGPGARRAAESEPFGARLERLLNDEAARESFKLNEAELADYLARNATNAPSLLIAFELSHDRDFLRRAAERFPNDPFVQAKILSHDLFPEQRSEWIQRFKQSAPDNAFPNLLAARERMKEGDGTGALAEIVASEGKRFDHYTRETVAELEQAYLLAGRPVAESKAMASSEVLLPELAPFKKLGMDLRDLASQHSREGDAATASALLEGAWILGSQLKESGSQGVMIDELVGLAIQNISLKSWPEGVEAPFLGRSVADELAANTQFRNSVRTSASLMNAWQPQASENEVIAFYDRLRLFGERNTMEWLRRQHPEITPEGTLVSEK